MTPSVPGVTPSVPGVPGVNGGAVALGIGGGKGDGVEGGAVALGIGGGKGEFRTLLDEIPPNQGSLSRSMSTTSLNSLRSDSLQTVSVQHLDARQSYILSPRPLFVKMAKSGFGMCFDIGSRHLGAGAKTRLHTPKAVAYHEQPHYCRFRIGHSFGRMESRIKKFTPPCVCRHTQRTWIRWHRYPLL